MTDDNLIQKLSQPQDSEIMPPSVERRSQNTRPRASVLLFNRHDDTALAYPGTLHVSTNHRWPPLPVGVIWFDLTDPSTPRIVSGYPYGAHLSALLAVATYGQRPGMDVLVGVSDLVGTDWTIDLVHDRSGTEVQDCDDMILIENTLPTDWMDALHPWTGVGSVFDECDETKLLPHCQQWLTQIRNDRAR